MARERLKSFNLIESSLRRCFAAFHFLPHTLEKILKKVNYFKITFNILLLNSFSFWTLNVLSKSSKHFRRSLHHKNVNSLHFTSIFLKIDLNLIDFFLKLFFWYKIRDTVEKNENSHVIIGNEHLLLFSFLIITHTITTLLIDLEILKFKVEEKRRLSC